MQITQAVFLFQENSKELRAFMNSRQTQTTVTTEQGSACRVPQAELETQSVCRMPQVQTQKAWFWFFAFTVPGR